MSKKIRNVDGNNLVDPSTIANLTFSNKSGAQKQVDVGRALLPLQSDATTWTTNATTAIPLPAKGKCLAVYNKSGTVQSLTLGDDGAMAALAIGATDGSGNVGIACTPNDWTVIACGERRWVRADSANLVVYLIDDDTSIKQEAAR